MEKGEEELKMVRFNVAGKQKPYDKVFLTSRHRSYKKVDTIFHRNDYHTEIKMDKEVFKTNFKFNKSTWIYDNLTKITWKELEEIADIYVYVVN